MLGSGLEFYLVLIIFALPGIALGFTVHELCHALVATGYGDPLPRAQGRLSLNPAEQIHPVGLVALLVFGFGFARPVVFNPMYVRKGWQRAWLAFAGPLSNLLLAAVFGVLLHLVTIANPSVRACLIPSFNLSPVGFIYWFLTEGFFVNVILFVFNLIPIPPLDGYRVLEGLFRGTFPGIFQWIDAHSGVIVAVAILLFFFLPAATNGNSFIGAPITGAANWLWSWVVTGPQPPAFFPSIYYLFTSNTAGLSTALANPCSPLA